MVLNLFCEMKAELIIYNVINSAINFVPLNMSAFFFFIFKRQSPIWFFCCCFAFYNYHVLGYYSHFFEAGLDK